MTLEDAIKHAEEVVDKKEREKQKWERWLETDRETDIDYRAVVEKVSCELCIEEYRQLADWLKELKQLRKQEPCEDAISRQAVENKLLKLCNELEGIFANIRMQNQDESVCGLCEYDCPAPYECPGFDIEDCFKLADEIRHEWQSTKDLPPVKPAEKVGHWIYDDDCREHGHCSECGYGSIDIVDGKPHNYCQDCGAKMEV